MRFIELRPFETGWKGLELDDNDLFALQDEINVNPAGSPVVQGTGGLRKMRFASKRWKSGKRGAARIGYVYLRKYSTVLLVIAYSKREKDDLSKDEKKTISSIIQRIEREFASRVMR